MPVTFGQSRTFEIKETSSLFDIAFHPSKPKLIAASTVEGHVLLLDGNQDSCPVILTLEKHHKGSSVRKVRFADEKTLVSAAKTVKIFDLDSSKAIRKLENGGVKIYSLLVVDNYLLCTGSDDGCFKLWDYRTPRGCVMELNECEDYISDMDIDSAKRIVVASSGEGTLSAFNVRAKRLEEPQSELFDAGFQAVRYLEPCNKVLAGTEDGAINIFNIGEWGNISDRFPVKSASGRNRGGCSVDCIEVIGGSVIVTGSSDGLIRAVNILPNKVLQTVEKHDTPIECLAIQDSSCTLASTDTNTLKLCTFEAVESESSDSDEEEEEKKEVPKNSFFSDLV